MPQLLVHQKKIESPLTATAPSTVGMFGSEMYAITFSFSLSMVMVRLAAASIS